MTEPNWAKVLRVLYEKEGEVEYHEFDKGDSVDVTVPKGSAFEHISLEKGELSSAIQFLDDNGLVKKTGGSPTNFTDKVQLLKDGFAVAHERRLRERQHELTQIQVHANGTMANFTIILGIMALFQALAAIVVVPKYKVPLGITFLLFVGMLWYKRDDWFYWP